MKKVVLCILLTATIFATMEVALKIAGTSIDSFELTFLRFLIGGLILLPPALMESRHRGYRLNIRDCGWMLLLGTVFSLLKRWTGINGSLSSSVSSRSY